jgi:hypothetical protein
MRFVVTDPGGGMERTTLVNADSFASAAAAAERHWPQLQVLNLVLVSEANAPGGVETRPSFWQRVLGWFR